MELKQFYEYTGIPTEESINEFKETFERFESDKSSARHSYHNLYAALFEDRSKVNDVLEVGVYYGASLRAWKVLFENAHIVGLDNNTNHLFQEDRIRTLYADQNSFPSFDYVYHILKNQTYEMIVDDGSHYWHNIVDTLNKTMKWVNPGGWYIVEDIRLEYEEMAKEFAESIEKNTGFKTFLINMNDALDPDPQGIFDNIVLAVHKVK
jgi:hypothetical protein